MREYQLPARFETFPQEQKDAFLQVLARKERGELLAGTFCTFAPCEILDAAGIHSVRLCGRDEETILAAERHLPKNLCPLIKSSYGAAVSDACPYTYFADLIVGETSCDGKKKMYELLSRFKNVYVLQLPQGADRSYAQAMWTQELRRFRSVLEDTFHVVISDEAIRAAAGLRNQLRQAQTALMDLLKLDPPPLSGMELFGILDRTRSCFDLNAGIEALKDQTARIRADYDAGKRPIPAGRKRILITGCPVGGVLEKTVQAVEENGGTVVCFETCEGVKAARHPVDTQAEDIFSAIARRDLNTGCAVMSPNRSRMELLPQLAAEFRVDGILEVELPVCHPYTVERREMERLAEHLDLPFLAVSTDYSQADVGPLTTRIAAFLELL